jgi:2-polyprenyl-3-methyl-5-hydroxy-6-metoxy-1,4-benzoquinol methylase
VINTKETLGNTDKIYEAYKGKLDEGIQQSTRERFSWQASMISGQNVLDIGCSQGILPILLAREGKDVIGIDISEDAISFANRLKSKEAKTTQQNVKFIQGDFIQLDIKEKFDTVILGETLEHFFYPEKIIDALLKNLNKNGKVIITVPFGIHDYYDHRKTYYIHDLIELVSENFVLTNIKYSELRNTNNWVGIVAEKRDHRKEKTTKIDSGILKDLEENFYKNERRILDITQWQNKEIKKQKKIIEKNKKEIDNLKSRFYNEKSNLNKTIQYKDSQLSDLTKKIFELEKEIRKFKNRKIIRMIDYIKNIIQKPTKKMKKAIKIMKRLLKKFLKSLFAVKAQIIKNRLEKLAKHIPDSNGSAIFKKLDINVAVITDEFMFNYYKDSLNLKYINQKNYKNILNENIDFLLFVSCWRGMDNDDWRYLAYKDEKKEELFKIFDYAKFKNIKIVFQTIEDPSNYEFFLPIAKKSDYIFTSDQDKIDNYIKDTDNKNVFFLEYGINPFIQNPIGCNLSTEKRFHIRKKVFFAGSWAGRYKDRCKDARTIFDGVLKSKKPFVIADRNFNIEMDGYNYPFKYQSLLIPAIDHKILQKIHKLFGWNINLNSIKDSTTMCAMRIYELQALGSLVLSNYAISVYNRFPNIFIINDSTEVKYVLNGYSDKEKYYMKVKGIRNVYTNSTVFDRLSYIFGKIKLNQEIEINDKLLVICKKKTDQIEKMFNSQTFSNKQLIEESDIGNTKVNNYDFVTFFSESNDYSYFYLEDMMNCFKFVDVPYVTKSGYFNDKDKLIGITHNFVNSYEDRNKTIFNLKDFTLKQILFNSKKNLRGYSSDPFGINEKKYSIKEIEGEPKDFGVIIPIYNNGEFLYGKAFLSLLRSSIFNKMHILLVDDGSSDKNTVKIVKDISERYSNITTYFFSKGGSGSASRSRNKGLKLLNTEFIAFFDPDDEVSHKGYQSLLNTIRRKNYNFVFGFSKKFYKGKELERGKFNKNQPILDTKKFLINNHFSTQNIQSCVFRKDFIIENKLFFINKSFGEDTLFFYQMMIQGTKSFYLNKCIFYYFADRNSSCSNSVNISFFKRSLLTEIEQVKFLESKNLLDEYVSKKYHYFIKNWYGKKLESVNEKDYGETLKILKKITGLYDFNIENNTNKGYLHKIPFNNGSAFFEKFPINIGIITDSLAFNYFNNSANFTYIGPNNYKAVLDNQNIGMLMFITCWRGMDNEDLKGISGDNEVRNSVIDIFKYARSKGLPIVYWSKEDPVHYDIYHEFSKYADYIFTTAEECLLDYKSYTGNNNVYTLEFGVNPFIHNPIGFRVKNQENFDTLNKVLFAGSWYKTHQERVKDQAMLFDGVIESNKELAIIDRNYFLPSPQLTYPEKYQRYTYPTMEYNKLQQFHKLFDWSLDLNTIKDSNTMCAARVFELQGSGSAMISNPTKSVEKKFPNVFIGKTSEEVKNILNNTTEKEIHMRQIQGIRNVYTNDTVFDRLDYILNKVGLIKNSKISKEIIVICDKTTPKIQKMFDKQTYENKRLIERFESQDLKTDGFIAFFSEKYNYGINYLQDMVNGFKYTDSAFITKDSDIEHNYVKITKDKYKTMFNPRKIKVGEILNKQEFKGDGYSIDPFEI